jgi:hypothetical protein
MTTALFHLGYFLNMNSHLCLGPYDVDYIPPIYACLVASMTGATSKPNSLVDMGSCELFALTNLKL